MFIRQTKFDGSGGIRPSSPRSADSNLAWASAYFPAKDRVSASHKFRAAELAIGERPIALRCTGRSGPGGT